MTRTQITLILALSFTTMRSALAQTNSKRVSSFQFHWDAQKNVEVVLESPSSHSPGDFSRIRIRVPRQKELTLTNKNGWVKYGSKAASKPSQRLGAQNVARSGSVLALKVAEDRTALFLFGYVYASSPGSLDVIEISGAGAPTVVLHRDELGLKDVRDLDGDGVAEIVGYPCLSQEFGNGLLTYDPFHVYKLAATPGNSAKLSLPLSKTYNLKHYYGWAGAQCREDIAVVLHPPKGGKPVVMSTREAEKLTEDSQKK